MRTDLDPDRGAVTSVVGRRDVIRVELDSNACSGFLNSARDRGLPHPIHIAHEEQRRFFFTTEMQRVQKNFEPGSISNQTSKWRTPSAWSL